jgi:hypothetical protein
MPFVFPALPAVNLAGYSAARAAAPSRGCACAFRSVAGALDVDPGVPGGLAEVREPPGRILQDHRERGRPGVARSCSCLTRALQQNPQRSAGRLRRPELVRLESLGLDC